MSVGLKKIAIIMESALTPDPQHIRCCNVTVKKAGLELNVIEVCYKQLVKSSKEVPIRVKANKKCTEI